MGQKRPDDAMGAAFFRGVSEMCCDVLWQLWQLWQLRQAAMHLCKFSSALGRVVAGKMATEMCILVAVLADDDELLDWRVMRGQKKE